MERKRRKEIIRNFIFGVEDSLVSTVGLVSGITIVGSTTSTVFLTGMVLIFVEAFSMGVGSFLSAHGAESYEASEDVPMNESALYGFVMFFSYLFAGFFVILPFLLFSKQIALFSAIFVSVFGLFFLGVWSAKVTKTNVLKRGLLMLLLGGGAILLGIVVGKLVKGISL